MDVITTHINADFDCLGSMIAAKRLYPDAEMVFPGGQERSVREFFIKSVQYAFGFKRVRDIDLAKVTRLILVDVKQASRIGPFAEVASRKGVEIHIYDHHPVAPGDLSGSFERIEQLGSTSSLFAHLFMEKGIEPTPDEATMMMLGLYEDTGNLTFHTTTTRDYEAASFLLSHGASLNVVSDIAVHEMTPDQVRLLNDLLGNQSILNVHGVDVAVAHASIDYFVGDIANLAHKLKDMENLDVLFMIVRMESRVFVVARSRLDDVNVGEILAEFGGGGHASAASCAIRDMTLVQILERLPAVLEKHIHPHWQVSHLMSTPVKTVDIDDSLDATHRVLARYNINAMPVVSGRTVRGVITRQLVDKAVYHELQDHPVSEYMSSDFHTVTPETPVDVLKSLIVESNQRFVPVVSEDALVGAVTRTDLLRHLTSSSGAPPRSGERNLITRGGRKYKPNQVQRLIRNRLDTSIQEKLASLGTVADGLGVSIFVVGGFVRDLLLDQENHDLDIVVEGDGIIFAETFAKEHGCRVRCHRKFGTAVVIYPDGFKLDIASARMEYYLHPGALPDVEHASVKMDLYRRDFTVNTLAIMLNKGSYGELLDYYGGQRDLEDKAIRVLHNLSFVEDPTRVFRAVRFEQRLGFTIGKQTEHLLRSAVKLGLLERVSGKRLYNELYLILTEDAPLPAVLRLARLNLLQALHPALSHKIDFEVLFDQVKRSTDWYDLLYTGKPSQRWLCYLMALSSALDRPSMVELCDRLQLPQRFRDRLIDQRQIGLGIRRKLERRKPSSRPPKASDLYRWFQPLSVEILLFLMASTTRDSVRQWISLYITQLRNVRSVLTGKDLEKLGIPPGPVFKTILEELLKARLDGRVQTADDERLLVRRKYMKSAGRRGH